MNWVTMIICGCFGLYQYAHGERLYAYFMFLLAGVSFYQHKIERIIQGVSNLIDASDFSPIQIDIQPNWKKIFIDQKLVNDDTWKDKFWERIKDEKYHVCKDGIRFTLLKPDLIFWNNGSLFSTEVDFRFDASPVSSLGSNYVRFKIKGGLKEGFELSLSTPESREKFSSGWDLGVIKIATIPYSEFGICKTGDRYESIFIKKEQRDQNLKKYEWTRDIPDAEYRHISDDNRITLEHKYFSVYYNYV